MGKLRIERKHAKLLNTLMESGILAAQRKLPRKNRLTPGMCYLLITMKITTVRQLLETHPGQLVNISPYFDPAEFINAVKKMFSHSIFKTVLPDYWR